MFQTNSWLLIELKITITWLSHDYHMTITCYLIFIQQPLVASPFHILYTMQVYLYLGNGSHGPSASTADPTQEVTADSTPSERCPLCDLTLGSDSCFNRHIRSSLKSGRVMYKCRICRYEVTKRPRMMHHLGRCHTTKKFSCRHCSYKSHRREDIRDHMTSLHKGNRYTSVAAVTGRARSNLILVR